MPQTAPDLSRNLKNRHIQLIAIGGTIGVGLFLGSAKAIHNAGPGLLLAYAAGGVAIFFIMRALGELLTYRPVAGSFATYADEFCGPFAGFVTGWSYWFMWILTAMAELTAIGIYVRYWLPEVPQWLPALIALVVLYGTNLLAVRVFGELEFWFALIKVVTIVALIAVGFFVIVFHAGELGATASFSNLWTHGGFLPFGIGGVLLTLQIVMFAYSGVELIGVTAGEAENPAVVLPRATNGITARILIFYLGALIIIMALVPWTQLSPSVSPFVFVFGKLGVPGAAAIINLVVITAATSSCNSGLFSTGRMLWSLAQRGQAPRAFATLNRQQVPAAGIQLSAAALLLVVVLLQQGKGGDIAAAFGGAGSQTAFGARSGATFLTRATAVLGALFVLGSLGLGLMEKNGIGGSVMSGVAAPATSKSAVPALPTTSAPPPIPAAAPSTSGTSGTSSGSAPVAGGSQSKTPVAPGAKKGGGR